MFWSGLGFTLLITAFTFQLYFLVNGFWTRVNLQGGWDNSEMTKLPLYLNEENGQTSSGGTHTFGLTVVDGLKCSMAMVIAFMAMGGRAGPVEALIISLFGTISYEVNRQTQTLYASVIGCSNYVFTFAGFMGGIMSLLLVKCKQS